MTISNTATPAQRAMACLHETPNGGYAIRSGCGEEFAQIPCWHEVDAVKEREVYIYEGWDDGDELILSIAWEDEEFFIHG